MLPLIKVAFLSLFLCTFSFTFSGEKSAVLIAPFKIKNGPSPLIKFAQGLPQTLKKKLIQQGIEALTVNTEWAVPLAVTAAYPAMFEHQAPFFFSGQILHSAEKSNMTLWLVTGDKQVLSWSHAFPPNQYATATESVLRKLLYYIKENRFGLLTLSTFPVGAKLYIDNEYRGKSPSESFVKSGRHSLRIEKSGYLLIKQNVFIEPGRTRDIRISLKSQVKKLPAKNFLYASLVATGLTLLSHFIQEKSHQDYLNRGSNHDAYFSDYKNLNIVRNTLGGITLSLYGTTLFSFLHNTRVKSVSARSRLKKN